MKADVPAAFIAMKKKETPLLAKILAGLAVAYALSPVDLIPDFIPVLGMLDDIIIVPGLIALAVRMIPKDVMEECRAEAAGMWANGKPKKWRYALPIIFIWALTALVILKIIF